MGSILVCGHVRSWVGLVVSGLGGVYWVLVNRVL